MGNRCTAPLLTRPDACRVFRPACAGVPGRIKIVEFVGAPLAVSDRL
jgi:hypothetical protein